MIDKKRIISISVLLILVIFVSGCQQAEQCPVEVSQTKGLVIQDLRMSYDEVPVGDTVSLQAEIQNRGTDVAENIVVDLWGHTGFSVVNEEGQTIGDGEPSSDVINSLAPPNLDVCSAGDVKIVKWNLKAGCDPRETSLAISVDYDYESKGWASIFLVSSDEAEKAGRFEQTGENVPSAGPIQTKIEPVQNEPVILGENGDFDVRIRFENVGNGLTQGPKDNEDKRASNVIEEVVLSVEGPCNFTDANENEDEDATEDVIQTDSEENQYLLWKVSTGEQVALSSNSQEAVKVAHLTVPEEQLEGFIKDFCTITSEAKYHYRIVESTSGKVGITGSTSQVKACREAE